jgi:hypothetical protein
MYSLYLDLPEDGDLIAETCRLQAHVWRFISFICICWYDRMITEAMHRMNNIKNNYLVSDELLVIRRN